MPDLPNGEDVIIRPWTEDDISEVTACERAAYPDFDAEHLWNERLYRMQFEAFPEGQLLAEHNGRVVGYATSLIVQLADDVSLHSYDEITGLGTFTTHTPSGDTLYGADIAVRPEYRGRGIAQRLYEGRRDLMRRYNLRRMVAGGRIPGYNAYAGIMTPEQYVEKVVAGELKDPALNAHLRAGYEVKGIFLDYLMDESSLNYATVLEMPNPEFRPERRKIAGGYLKRPVRNVRVCASQYEMCRIGSWDDFVRQVEFHVTTADEYHSHFLLFPELFTAQLFSIIDARMTRQEAVVELAGYTDRYIDLFVRLAKKYNLYIIGGTHPVYRDGLLRNAAHLFTPKGNVHIQEKLHVTPHEREVWGIHPGTELTVFETGMARIAIQVCYDIEFPETSRLLALAGAEIIFVPSTTDEKKAYLRVRYCAQARAIENWLYVVLTGNVGNLPQVRSFLINYSQAAVFTPSDFAYPMNATAAEADPNSETVVITDLEVGALTLQREMATVRPLRDRRPDLYDLRSRYKVKVVRVE